MNVAIFGGSYRSAPTKAIEIGYFINKDEVVSLQFTDLPDNDSFNSRDSEGGSALSVDYKIFTGNSFYIKPGIYYRNQKDITGYTYNNSIEDWVTRDFAEIEDIGVNFRIGNQWQWSNFTVGCDWIGANSSIITLSKSGINEDIEDLEVSATLLNLYLGISF